MILKSMDVRRRVGCGTIVCVVLVYGLVVVTSEGSRRALQSILGNGYDDVWMGEVDEHTAEQIWNNCRQEVMEMKDQVVDLNSYFLWEASGVFNEAISETALLRKKYWHAIFNSLSPDVKQSLLVCSRSAGYSSTTSWIAKYINMFHDRHHAQRRFLIRKPAVVPRGKRHQTVITPVSSPFGAPSPSPFRKLPLSSSATPSPSPLESPSPSPTLAPYSSSSPSPIFRPPAEAPVEASPTAQLSLSPSVAVHPIPGLANKQHSQGPSASDNNDQHKKKVLIALIAMMSVAIIILAALLIYLLKNKKNKVGSRHEQKDDRPRPSVMSAEPSQNTRGLENAASSKDFGIPSGKIQSSPYIASAGAGGAFDAKSSGPVSVNIDGIVTAPFPEKSAASPPIAPPPPPAPAPRPPPLPKGVRPPPPPGRLKPLPPKGAPGGSSVSKGGDNSKSDSEVPKAKLKPFFWDKVQAKDDQSMVWHELKAGSFQVNEEMMESLFGYAPMDKSNVERKKESPSLHNVPQYVKLIDPKKAQNLSILLRALNVTTEEVCNALQEGNELPAELIQTLIKMMPSSNEELKLRLYDGELSQLGPAERFLKQLVEIPHSFKRLESLLLMSTYPEEIANIKESHETLEVACHKLRNSRLFLKLLEAVLKTGNRMNDGTYRGGAQAFKLDTLLKLSDVKGTDGKTTLLHFVVQEMIRSEGIRAVRIARESLGDESSEKTEEYFKSLGLQVVSGLSTELEDVKKAAVIDADGITCSVSKLGHSLVNTREFLNTKMKNLDEDSQSQFVRKLATFVELAEAEIPHHIEEEKRIIALIKSTADYFHGNAGKEEGLRLFIIVRDFLIMLDKVCKEIQHSLTKPQPPRKQGSTSSTEAHQPNTQLSDVPQRLFPAIQERRTDDSSSDDDSS